MSETPKETKPWHWHLYRPEALMIYVFIALGIYTTLQNQPDLQIVRSFPLDDGSAILMGHDLSNSPRRVSIWRSEQGGSYSWLEDLEDDYIPALDNASPQPICAAQENTLYLLTGQTTPFDQRLFTIQAINLTNGEVEWTNRQQPTGDAAFVSLHLWGGQLVTAHRAVGDAGTRRLYLTGRSRRNGEMQWTRIFEYEKGLDPAALATAITYLPGQILVQHEGLKLLDIPKGEVLRQWPGSQPHFHGGWIFYRDSLSLRALSTDFETDTSLFPLPEAPLASIGFSGFYRGFPIHYSRALGWERLLADTIARSAFNGGIPASVYPNCCSSFPLATGGSFLSGEWTRYLPLFLEPNDLATIRELYPEAIRDPDLSGSHLVLLDNESLAPTFIGKRLKETPKGVFLSEGKYHYFLTTADGGGQRPLIVQIDGEAGTLSKVIRSSHDFRQLHDYRQDQPVGRRIWITGPRHYAALITPDLLIGTASTDSIDFEDVTSEYAKIWGLE